LRNNFGSFAIRRNLPRLWWIVGCDTDLPVGPVIVFIAAPFREMGSPNFAVSF